MPYVIDNPGGGDCGYYAFAVGLIDIIQHEYAATGSSATFYRWKKTNELPDVTLQNILELDLIQLIDEPNNYKKDVLNRLQMSLRKIALNAYKTDLLPRFHTELISPDKPTIVEGSPIYHKFMELVLHYKKNPNTPPASNFNELALSPKVLELAKETAEALKEQIKDKPVHEHEKIENNYVKSVFKKDVLRSDGEFNPDSIILKGSDKIKEQGRWATHSDLKEVADTLRVNLVVTGRVNGALLKNSPTVKLNNHADAHWTTEVPALPLQQAQILPHKRKSSDDIAPLVQATKVVTGATSVPSELAKEKQEPKPTETQAKATTNTTPKTKETAKREPEKSERPSKLQRTERALTTEESNVIERTVSAQGNEELAKKYREHLQDLVRASSKHGMFATEKETTEISASKSTKQTDPAVIKQIKEDHDLAERLQEEEFRQAGLK